MKDFLGKEINVGSFVVYPGRRGSSLWLEKGVVTRLDTDLGRIQVRKDDQRLVLVSSIDRVVVINA